MILDHTASPDLPVTKYKLDERKEITAETIGAFVADFFADELKPYFKSEPEPKLATQNGLTKIVGSTHASIVNDPTQDVFVFYYAPWCSHCKEYLPVWERFADEDADKYHTLTIGKFDATANEVEGLTLKEYPTLIYYPRWNKQG